MSRQALKENTKMVVLKRQSKPGIIVAVRSGVLTLD